MAISKTVWDGIPSILFPPSGEFFLTGLCEAQLWIFTGPPGILNDDNAPQLHWVAAESLEAALRYMRQRYDDFSIREARLLGMIPLLSGSPLD
jgi:hypothetical protein